jgi:tetratricopeptide (TPR) repeat protein
VEHLRSLGHEPILQDEFPIVHQKIGPMLATQIAPCDAVLLLVGPAFGARPADWPADWEWRSYTQLEYDLAVEMQKPVFRFVVGPDCPLDPFDAESEPKHQLQAEYVRKLADYLFVPFDSAESLERGLARAQFHNLMRHNLPFASIGTLFKGRDDTLARIRHLLLTRPANAAAVTAKQAIHGLGGVGKTRLALEYAYRFASEYSARFYVPADTPLGLTFGLASLCGEDMLNLPEKNEQDVNEQVKAVLRWFRTNANWLLLLDNVDTPEAASAVTGRLKDLANGHVVITSRLTEWRGGVSALELDTLSESASADFLLERTGGNADGAPTGPKRRFTSTDRPDAASLARELGGLALALEQAGAYIAHNRISFAEYRDRLAKIEAEALGWFDPEQMKDYPKSVALTWQASVSQLYDDGRTLLNVLAWLAPSPLPVELIRGRPSGVAAAIHPIRNRERAISDLTAYSLAKWSTDSSAVTIHRLVQDVTRFHIPGGARRDWVEDALRLMAAFVEGDPIDVRTWKSVYEPAQNHMHRVIAHGDAAQIPEPTNLLLNQLGLFLNTKAAYADAEPLLRRALALDESTFGPDDPNVALRLNNLAHLLQTTNRLAEAEPLMRRALAIDERCFGPDHSDVARDINNLAHLLEQTNRLEEAEPLLARGVAIFEKTLGDSHPSFATALGNLALLLHTTNRTAEAEPLLRRALAINEHSFGDDHPNVAIALNNLATVLQATNRLGEAEPLAARVVAIFEKSFGEDHPNVATALNNLAQLLDATNRLAEAEPLMRRALAIDERCFGLDHPNVASRLSNLAQLMKDTNRLAEAEPLMVRGATILENALGDSHPDVATALGNLAMLLHTTNRAADAEPLLRRAVDIDERSYGPDHPNVARDLANLASLLHDENRLAEAESLDRRALAICEQSFGEDHPRVAGALTSLAVLLRGTNRPAEAEPLHRRALAIDERSFGEGHPKVATDLLGLASLLLDTNRHAEAEPLLRRALAIHERSFGPDHPKVSVALNNLAQLLQTTNRLAEAEPLMRRALVIDERSYGEGHPRVATDLNNLAQLLQDTNRLAEAEPLVRRALSIDERCFGPDHPSIATRINNLATLLFHCTLCERVTIRSLFETCRGCSKV